MKDFALIVHPTSEELLHRYEPGMKNKPRPLVKKVLEWMSPFKASDVTGLCSETGKKAEGFLVMCPLLMEQMTTLSPSKVIKAINKAAQLAQKLGTKIIGLGAYAALIGNKGLDIAKNLDLPVTTGAAYTLAMIPEAIFRATALMDMPIEKAKILIIGATNSVGRICIEVLSRSSNTLILASRSQDRLNEIIKISKSHSRAILIRADDIERDAQQADIIVYAANQPLLPFNISKLKPGTIIFDSSYPRKIHQDSRDDILIIDGVAIKPPGEAEFNFDFGLPKGLAFPCMAEPIVLVFENRFETFSLGKEITFARAMEILRLATKHGFEVAELTSAERVLPRQEVLKIRDAAASKKIKTHRYFLF